MHFTLIKDIAFINSNCKNSEDIKTYFSEGIFSRPETWENHKQEKKVAGLKAGISSPLRKRMSELSLGICNALARGPVKDPSLLEDEEIYLFTGFGEIETTDRLLKSLMLDKDKLVSPTLFHNSVHNTPLGYFTILHKLTNACSTITDGIKTNLSFIHFLNYLSVLGKKCIISAGDEYSAFFELGDRVENKTEREKKLDFYPMYLAYKLEPDEKRGFLYLGEFDCLEDLIKTDHYSECEALFCTKELFLKCTSFSTSHSTAARHRKKIYSDYAVTRDNPCAFCFRLALPFLLAVSGLVLEEAEGKIYCYKVVV